MGASEFLNAGEMRRIDEVAGAVIRVHRGNVWITQHNHTKDYVLGIGGELVLSREEGPALVTAFKPSLIELYRADAVAVRQKIEGNVRRARNAALAACFRRLTWGIVQFFRLGVQCFASQNR